MSINDPITADAEASERNPDAPLKPGTKMTRGHQRSKTLQVRMNPDELDALAAIAGQRGIPVSTLARDLLLAHIAERDTSTKGLIAKIRAELDALASRVA